MSWPDFVNGSFELFAGGFVLLSVRKTLATRSSGGASWVTVAFFSSWGWWNLFYYPHLGQPWSTIGAIFVCAANCAWAALLWKFRRS